MNTMSKSVESLKEISKEELKLAELFWTHINGHTFEEYAFGLDCENEIADEAGKMYEDALNNAPEQVPNMDPIEKFNPDDVVKKIAERDQIPTSAVYDAIDLVYHIREYNDLHEKIYGIPGSVMLN